MACVASRMCMCIHLQMSELLTKPAFVNNLASDIQLQLREALAIAEGPAPALAGAAQRLAFARGWLVGRQSVPPLSPFIINHHRDPTVFLYHLLN